MRRAAAEMIHMFRAVDRMTQSGKEDRMGHGRIVPFLGEVIYLHPEGLITARGRRVTGNPGRYRPDIFLLTINADGHLLAVLIDGDKHLRGIGGPGIQQN